RPQKPGSLAGFPLLSLTQHPATAQRAVTFRGLFRSQWSFPSHLSAYPDRMRTSVSTALLLVTHFLAAQSPTLTRSNYFVIGDSALEYLKYDTSLWSVSIGPLGQGVTWDFSAIDLEHPSVMVDTLLFIDPAGTPFYPT